MNPEKKSPVEIKTDHVDQLEKLARLRDQGILTEEAFNEQKARILLPCQASSKNSAALVKGVRALAKHI